MALSSLTLGTALGSHPLLIFILCSYFTICVLYREFTNHNYTFIVLLESFIFNYIWHFPYALFISIKMLKKKKKIKLPWCWLSVQSLVLCLHIKVTKWLKLLSLSLQESSFCGLDWTAHTKNLRTHFWQLVLRLQELLCNSCHFFHTQNSHTNFSSHH